MVANSDKVDKDIVLYTSISALQSEWGTLHVANRCLSDKSKTVNHRSALGLRHA
jgi:hypothetical protein